MTAATPSPRWSDLLLAINGPAPDCLGRPWAQAGEAHRWYARGTWALGALAGWHAAQNAKKAGGRPAAVWLPDYFCNQSTFALRTGGAEISFYPVTPTLEPNWTACRNMLALGPCDMFVLVHYFGHAGNVATAQSFCRETGATLVEDAAHVLAPHGAIASGAGFTFYSPHKMLAVPDGAILVGTGAGATAGFFESPPAVAPAAPMPWAWLAKRAAQKLLPKAALRARNRRLPDFDTDPAYQPLAAETKASAAACRLLAATGADLDGIAQARKLNAATWREIAGSGVLGDCRAFLTPEAEGPAPYRFVLACATHDQAATTYVRLRGAGCPVESWPDLAPEVLADPARFATALMLRRTLLMLPVHQSMTPADLRGFAAR
jgi:hypothetical protein